MGNAVKSLLQVENGIGRRVGDTPELFFTGLHVQDSGSVSGDGRILGGVGGGVCGDVVNRDFFEGNAIGSAARGFGHSCALSGRLIANDKDAMAKPGDGGLDVFNAVYDDGAGGAAENGGVSDAVDVRVIPIKAGRFIGGKRDVVLKGLASIDDGFDDFVLMASGRSVCAVIVDVEGVHAHLIAAGAAIRRIELHHEATVRSVVGDGDDEVVARLDVKRGIFETAGSHEAVKSSAGEVRCCLIRKLYGEDTVLAEEGGGLVNDAAGFETRAGVWDRHHHRGGGVHGGRRGGLGDGRVRGNRMDRQGKDSPKKQMGQYSYFHGFSSNVRCGWRETARMGQMLALLAVMSNEIISLWI